MGRREEVYYLLWSRLSNATWGKDFDHRFLLAEDIRDSLGLTEFKASTRESGFKPSYLLCCQPFERFMLTHLCPRNNRNIFRKE